MLYTTEQRLEIISALRMVDEVIVYTDVDQLVKTVDFDVFALGGDQTHAGFVAATKWCQEHDKEIVRLMRTPGICSSEIKENIN